MNTALSAHSWDTQNRVQQSLDAGYEVTIHERPITVSGWSGAGYTQIDPSTGAGAYTIEGGSNGGWLALAIAGVLLAVGLYFVLLPFFVLFAAALPLVLAGLLGVLLLKINVDYGGGPSRAFLSNMAYGVIGFVLLGFLLPATAVASGMAAVIMVAVMLLTAWLNVIYA